MPGSQTLPNMQPYPYGNWTVKYWTVKFPGDICIVEIWTVKTGLRLRLRLGLRLVINVHNQGTAAPTFWPMSVVVKQLDGSTCHLVWSMEVRVGPDHIALDGNPAPP